jgi:hypothetical protein
MSEMGWIDFSSEHREKVRTVIDLLKLEGVVDELGVGVIRDSFSDNLFPGISTIQTRAKYFTLTALLLREYDGLKDRIRRTKTVEDFLTEREKECRIQLVRRYGTSKQLGIVGVRSGESTAQDVQRHPSSIYWSGMQTFGLLRTSLSIAEYSHRHSGTPRNLSAVLQETDDERGDDVYASDEQKSLVRVPEVDEDYWDNLSITLTKEEAAFLNEHITVYVPDSLLGQILLHPSWSRSFIRHGQDDLTAIEDLCELPFVEHLPAALRKILLTARDFWLLLYGAHVRYNCLLQNSFGSNGYYDEDWDEWLQNIKGFDWDSWETPYLWDVVKGRGRFVKGATRFFVERWIEETRRGHPSCQRTDQLITQQEKANKGSRARLRANADERVNKWIGISTLTYRIPQAREIIGDIVRSMSGKADPNAGR